MIVGLVAFGIYLTVRSRAYFNVLRAAYPNERFPFRNIWAAYVASYGFNNVIPARGGDLIKLYLVKSTIPNSSYPAVGSSIFVEVIFDLVMGSIILAYAFTQGVFPKPPDFSDLEAFDLSFFASNPQLTLFLLTTLGILVMVGFALLSRRVKAFWARGRRGNTIVFDPPRHFPEGFLLPLGGWGVCRTAFLVLL